MALALASASFAQQAPPPLPGTFYSAKDPDLPPMPFNPFPQLPSVEVAPGIYVVDDTRVPDTPEQTAARAAQQAAQELAARIDPATVQRLAEEAARRRQERYEREFVRWRHSGLHDALGRPTSRRGWLADKREAVRTELPVRWRESQQRQDALEAWAKASGAPLKIQLSPDRAASLTFFSQGEGLYLMPYSAVAADTISTDEVWPGGTSGLDLTGTGMTIGMWDEGSVRVSHLEFWVSPTVSRAEQRDAAAGPNPHSTAVAGVMAAAGLDYGPPFGRVNIGMAQNATVWAYDYVQNLFAEMDTAGTEGLRLSNHSFGPTAGWNYDFGLNAWRWWGTPAVSQTEDWKFGFYFTESAALDEHAYEFPEFLTVWAAGNDRNEGPAAQPVAHYVRDAQGQWVLVNNVVRSLDADEGGYDSLSGLAAAKNVLAVGAVADLVGGYDGPASVLMTVFSTYGPTDDGRIKPDVVANGVRLNTTAHDGDANYFIDTDFTTGTSFAAPSVAGSIALLAQRHEQLRPAAPPLFASTLKGLVIHTADEAGDHPGPDYRHGWGLMNTLNAAELLAADAASDSRPHVKEVPVDNGNIIEFPVVCAGGAPLRITIVWTDPPGPVDQFATVDPMVARLVNDLDLRVIGPDETTHFPWILNPDLVNRTAAARGAAATTGDDTRNNVEQVLIADPAAGTYTVRVTHKGTLLNQEPQWVSILVSGNVAQPKPDFRIINQAVTPVGDFALVWQAVVGQRYQVQYRNNIEGPGWTDIGPEVTAALPTVGVELAIDPQQPHRFFRVAEVE